MYCLKCSTFSSKPLFHGFHPSCFQEEFRLDDPLDFSDLREKASPGASSTEKPFKKFNTSFFHGAYKKYFALLGRKSYILKVRQDEHPELPIVEFVSNKIAEILEIPVPDFHFIKFQNSSDAFLSQNILDCHPHGVLQHIYKYLDKDADFNCKNLIRTIDEQTRNLRSVHKFVQLCLFDSLVGNHDRHGRNIAFIEKSGKKPILAPFYDNPSYIAIADDDILKSDLRPRGTIRTRQTDEPTLKDYVEEFQRLGFDDVVKVFYNKVVSRFDKILSVTNREKTLSPSRKKALVILIEKRLNEFENCQKTR